MLLAFLFLVASALLGIRLVNLVGKETLTKIEQLFIGAVVGWMFSTAAAYGIAYAVGRLSFGAMLAFNLIAQAAAVAVWLPVFKNLRSDVWKRFFRLDHLVPLFLLLSIAPLFYYLFSIRMFYAADDGLYSGGNSWNDMSLHLAISSSFLRGENFPPVFPAYAGEPLRYPFMPDFQTAVLMTFGATAYTALMMTAVPLALSIVGIFYSLARRVAASRAAAAVAAILFLFNGGFGFVYFLEDWRKSGKSFFEFWGALPVNYANLWEQKIHWSNVVVDCFLPQRTSLYGIPVALTAFIIFTIVWRRWDENTETEKWDGSKPLLLAGALVGTLPLFHAHSFVAVGIVSIFLFLIQPRRQWLAFWTPAVALAAVQMIGQLDLESHLGGGKFFYWQPGWKGNGEASWLLYLVRNIGLPLLLIVPAYRAAPKIWRRFYLAFGWLFAFCFFIMVTPHDYDNIKLLYYWYALTCIVVADWLVKLAGRRRQPFLAALFVFFSVFTGVLAMQRERQIRWRSFSLAEMAAAEFVAANTDPKAVILSAPQHNQPLMCLAGRTLLMGYGGWLWTHGYRTEQREADIRRIYAGDAAAMDLLRNYKVGYIYLSPAEAAAFQPNVAFLQQNFPTFYRDGEITIFKVGD